MRLQRSRERLGGFLLSQDPAVQVPSALEGLTVVFEMGTCGTPLPSPPNLGLRSKPEQIVFRKRISRLGLCFLNKLCLVQGLHPENRIRNDPLRVMKCLPTQCAQPKQRLPNSLTAQVCRISPRPISTGQLHVLLRFDLLPIYLVVSKGSYHLRVGNLILRGASRLDAFSVYPFRT